MFKFTHILVFIFLIAPTYSKATNLVTTIQKTKLACSDISDMMHDLKIKAGINTAITGVGTITSGIALGTGLAKKQYDDFLTEETKKILTQYENNQQDIIIIQDKDDFEKQLDEMVKIAESDTVSIQEIEDIKTVRDKSETLGKIRTGTLATSAVTNIAGTAIAATNTTDKELLPAIQNCTHMIDELTKKNMAAKIENSATVEEQNYAANIINACRDYETLDLTPIDNRAKSAAIFSGIAAGTSVAGTITSAIAASKQQENNKNLDTASNVMAGTSAAAGATATIFNATQIAAIKKAVAVAEKCEEALKQQ